MKTFIIRDFYIQTILVIAFSIALILDLTIFHRGICIIIYFLLAINHIISSNKRFFSENYTKTVVFKIYYFISMIFMLGFIALLINTSLLHKNNFLQEFWYVILIFGMFGTPVLAILYYFICKSDYEKIRNSKN